MSLSFYWDYKAVFCEIYDLYFAKALIHGFTRVMKPSFYYDSKAVFCKVYDLYFAIALIHGSPK